MISISKYSDTENYPFPNPQIDPRKKNAEYCMKWAEAIYAMYVSGGTSWSSSSVDFFAKMRQYAAGSQNSKQYQSFIKNEDTTSTTQVATLWDENDFTKEAKRSGYYNTLFQNLSPAPKILSSLIGLIGKG